MKSQLCMQAFSQQFPSSEGTNNLSLLKQKNCFSYTFFILFYSYYVWGKRRNHRQGKKNETMLPDTIWPRECGHVEITLTRNCSAFLFNTMGIAAITSSTLLVSGFPHNLWSWLHICSHLATRAFQRDLTEWTTIYYMLPFDCDHYKYDSAVLIHLIYCAIHMQQL